MRQALVRLHRYNGLALAAFLLVASLTGSLLAWNDELEALISPALFRVTPPSPDATPLDPLVLRERAQAAYPRTFVARVPLQIEPGHALEFRLYALPDPATGNFPKLDNDEIFIDPYTGEVLGERKSGDLSQGARNIMPFIYELHYALALGNAGTILMGVVGLLWTLDCFISAWLTFPVRARSANAAPWLSRWQPAWQVRWRGGSYKLNFDLHRAGGLWLWLMLFVLAWSSVAFNLRPVYDVTMRTLLPYQPDSPAPQLSRPLLKPPVSWAEAREIGRRRLTEQAGQRGIRVINEYMLIYDPRNGIYNYYARTDRDVSERWGITRVSLDARDGRMTAFWLPTGGAAGDSVRTWLTTLHMAAVWGLPLRIFMSLCGLAIAMLCVTGVLIWLRKRRARQQAPRRETRGSSQHEVAPQSE
jgi:uncharacterized iron-regulated membrane protein